MTRCCPRKVRESSFPSNRTFPKAHPRKLIRRTLLSETASPLVNAVANFRPKGRGRQKKATQSGEQVGERVYQKTVFID